MYVVIGTDSDVVASVFCDVIDHIAAENFAIRLALQPAVDIDNRGVNPAFGNGGSFPRNEGPRRRTLTLLRPERTVASGEQELRNARFPSGSSFRLPPPPPLH